MIGTEKRESIKLDFRMFANNNEHVSELFEYKVEGQRVATLHQQLLEGKTDNLKDGLVVMTGWKTESPYIDDSKLDEIMRSARQLADEIDDFWSIGIGGSYLGLRAGIEAVKGSLELCNLLARGERGTPRIFFLGNNMDPTYTARSLQIMANKIIGGNVISKSGTTVEPAIAFAIVENEMKARFSRTEIVKRIVAITDKSRGALKTLADREGYKQYVVPDNVGGRFSITSPVGLFTLAVAGLDIKQFIAGARQAEENVRRLSFDKNISLLRAVLRYIAYRYWQKKIEVASTGIYDLRSVIAWMEQLGPESEGKNGQGLWIAPEYYTEKAHANGQMIQQGERNIIETFMLVKEPKDDIKISAKGTPVEYLDGKSLHFANTAFVEGLRDAHYQGGVPVMSYLLPKLDEFTLGMFFQYEMNAIALSAMLLGQNPFIQPGVQMYKDIANARSGKPGTEKALAEMLKAEKLLNPDYII